jgi:hypothetical protein
LDDKWLEFAQKLTENARAGVAADHKRSKGFSRQRKTTKLSPPLTKASATLKLVESCPQKKSATLIQVGYRPETLTPRFSSILPKRRVR